MADIFIEGQQQNYSNNNFEMDGQGPKITREDWMQKKWRPMMAWVYMATCVCDFILFPVLWPALLATIHSPVTPWQPLTLSGAGLFHVAMGAVLGLTAYGRTQEKIAGANMSTPMSAGFNMPNNTTASTPTNNAPSNVNKDQVL
jgi:hypothetical protein